MNRVMILLAALLALMAPAFAGAQDAGGHGAELSVVCTTGMIADIAREVAGERAEVVGMMGPGVDPHLFKPTRSDIARLMRADLVFYNGLLLEGKMTDSLIRAANAGRRVWAVTGLIDEAYLMQPEDLEGRDDPHVWMDPTAWGKAVEVVRDKLIEVDPGGRDWYTTRAAAYIERLAALGRYADEVLGTVPERNRILVTAHDAFNYFGRRFGFEVVGIQGISTESEAGVQDIEEMVELLVTRGVRAVFVESTVADRNIRALIDGAGARGHAVVIGGELFSDAMGAQGTYEGTYLGMIDHNVTTIARSLGGSAPERGMTGSLAAPAR